MKSLEKKIVLLYNKGLGCVKISKELDITKYIVLKILNEKKIVRKRNRCDSLNYTFNDEIYTTTRKCPKCHETIKHSSKEKTVACRNYFNSLNRTCKKCSLELQIGSGNPFYGKNHKKETKEKISNSRKGKATGINNSMSNPIHKQNATNKLIKKWKSGEMEHVRKIMSDTGKKNHQHGKIKSINKSKAEDEIKNIIENLGYVVVSSFRIESKICDIFIPKLNLIIEYNGDYWHCNPKKYDKNYYNQKKSKYAWELWEYDNSKVDLIKKHNYNLEVVWESDFHTDKTIINKIIKNYGEI
jgi:hypothetical protein